MKKLKLFAKNYNRSIFYAVTIVLGMFIAFQELDRGYFDNFRSFVFITSSIFIIELYTGWLFRRQQVNQMSIPHLNSHTWFTELSYHLLLPLGMYLGTVGFGYFNRQQHLRFIILGLALFTLVILFTNIKAYYENRKQLETRTHYIYDIIKVIIFFTFSDTIFNITWGDEFELLGTLATTLVAWVFIMLILLRSHKLEFKALVVSILLVIGFFWGVTGLGQLVAHNPLQLSVAAVILFYFSLALVHHLLHRDLTWSIVLEYLSVAGLALLFIFGLS